MAKPRGKAIYIDREKVVEKVVEKRVEVPGPERVVEHHHYDVAATVDQAVAKIKPMLDEIVVQVKQFAADAVAGIKLPEPVDLGPLQQQMAELAARPATVERIETRVEAGPGPGPDRQMEVSRGEMRLKNADGTWGPWFKIGGHGGGGISREEVIQIVNAASNDGPTCVSVSLPAAANATDDYYFATDTGTFTLEAAPEDGRQVTIKRLGAVGNVVVDGNGNLIDGNTDITITQQYTAVTLFYCAAVGAWSIV